MADPRRRPTDVVLSFLSRDDAAVRLGGALAASGAITATASRSRWGRTGGAGLLGVAAALAAGGARHLRRRHEVLARWPAPGRLVDVGGFRMHVLAQGPQTGAPVVWLPGSHVGGYGLHHLHRMLAQEARSVLVDRPGSGWSDAGPFPRTTAREVDEVLSALAAAGEAAPYVLVGHSFGGLLAANIARRRPDLLQAVVLLDPTPADTVVYAPRVHALHEMRRAEFVRALRLLVGLRGRDAEQTARPVAGHLGEETARVLVAVEDWPAAALASASIFRELLPTGFAAVGWDTVVYDGDLGDLPVYLVAPPDMAEGEWSQVANAAPEEPERLRRFYTRTRERYLASSTRSERVFMPAGSGHNFPATLPDAVLDVVRTALEHDQRATDKKEARSANR